MVHDQVQKNINSHHINKVVIFVFSLTSVKVTISHTTLHRSRVKSLCTNELIKNSSRQCPSVLPLWVATGKCQSLLLFLVVPLTSSLQRGGRWLYLGLMFIWIDIEYGSWPTMRCIFALSRWSSSRLLSTFITPPLIPEESTFSGYRASPMYQLRGEKKFSFVLRFRSQNILCPIKRWHLADTCRNLLFGNYLVKYLQSSQVTPGE